MACALGKFGDRVVFVSALGDDDLGDQMLALLKGAYATQKRQRSCEPSPSRDLGLY